MRPTERPCWLCGSVENPCIEVKAGERVFLFACSSCLALALEELTGFSFTRQLDQWTRLSAFHKRMKEERGHGSTIPAKTRY